MSQPGTVGRPGQVIDRWIHGACLCYGLGIDEQRQSGLRHDYSTCQVEHGRNLVFASGAVMDRPFDTTVDRTRSRLDVPKVRTPSGSKGRPHRPGNDLSPRQAVVIEKPRRDLTIFKVHFGHLTLKAHAKGERVLRFEAIAHHAKQLGCGRRPDKLPQVTARPAGMVDRLAGMLDRVELGFPPDGVLDQPPAPSTLGATRTGGPDVNRPRTRAALAATLALAVAPAGFTVAELTTKVRETTGQTPEEHSVRQGAYDLRKLRGKQPVVKPGRTRRYHVPELAARTIAALLTLRDKVIAPLVAGIRTPRRGAPPKTWTTIDHDYETPRRDMKTLLADLGITTKATAAPTTNCRSQPATL